MFNILMAYEPSSIYVRLPPHLGEGASDEIGFTPSRFHQLLLRMLRAKDRQANKGEQHIFLKSSSKSSKKGNKGTK